MLPEDLCVGDELMVSVNEGTDEKPWHKQAKVQVIGFGNGFDENQALCYVPQYELIKKSFKLTQMHQRYYSFDPKFVGEYGMFVTDHSIITRIDKAPLGSYCCRCDEFFEGATIDESGYFTCYLCTQNPWR